MRRTTRLAAVTALATISACSSGTATTPAHDAADTQRSAYLRAYRATVLLTDGATYAPVAGTEGAGDYCKQLATAGDYPSSDMTTAADQGCLDSLAGVPENPTRFPDKP
ncbi:hypothetical protein P3T37_004349 [Kitasatospora sp. MAA4]|uniref:hypothetical protein n=1 Tax=Kitasatospora sp. MAA4 TaxID=3035093 RepID=UPI002473C7CE|nr:hypothetical protein [Kitasatospora sp. MAA4]MDH6134940.1 hypothetical protein [Kitasatospora sp. MAA4]